MVVTNADIAPADEKVFRLADVTYDKETSLSFIFGDAGTIPLGGRRRTGIFANDIEVVLHASDTKWLLSQDKIFRTNYGRYVLQLLTQGGTVSSVRRTVCARRTSRSLYRTTQMEQRATRRRGWPH